NEQFRNSPNEFPALGKGTNIFGNFWIAPRERPEFGHKMGVGQESNVKRQVSVFRYAMPISKTDAGDQNVLARFTFLKTLNHVRAQLMDVEPGGIDHQVCNFPNGLQMPALCG